MCIYTSIYIEMHFIYMQTLICIYIARRGRAYRPVRAPIRPQGEAPCPPCMLLVHFISAQRPRSSNRMRRPAAAHPAHGWGLPARWVPLIVLALSIYPTKDVDGVELFCGQGELTAAGTRSGMNFAGIDKFTREAVLHDVLSDVGLKHLIFSMCRCKQRGLVWIGMPCSSFVFVGRANSGRSAWLPAGDTDKEYTRLHNALAELAYNVALLAFYLGLVYVIEQPVTSCLFDWLPMVRALARTEAKRSLVHMSAFGGLSRKTMCLWGTAPWLSVLEEYSRMGFGQRRGEAEELVTQKIRADGSKCITGKRKALKESGAYTELFGEVVAAEQASTARACTLHCVAGPRLLACAAGLTKALVAAVDTYIIFYLFMCACDVCSAPCSGEAPRDELSNTCSEEA